MNSSLTLRPIARGCATKSGSWALRRTCNATTRFVVERRSLSGQGQNVRLPQRGEHPAARDAHKAAGDHVAEKMIVSGDEADADRGRRRARRTGGSQ